MAIHMTTGPITFTGASTASNIVSYTFTYSGTMTWTTPTVQMNTWQPPKKIKNGKYQVRCRSCARWAKVVKELPNWKWLVWCDRCLGENEGFVAW